MWTRFLSDYGMLFVLLALCAVLSVVLAALTWAGAGSDMTKEEFAIRSEIGLQG